MNESVNQSINDSKAADKYEPSIPDENTVLIQWESVSQSGS